MDRGVALEIVLELARQNVIEDPDMQEEHDRQVEAINIIEDLANEFIV